ncbi:hypothetical protein H6F76_25205 [Leptolyngbya sp. FACHB-321]|uniref:hypothetical protein n=1 Tax=Leptolyngbya sp. FACHB-321 TaxID=2692807 RepID=UPI001685E735|nr:hypothetical protein [Leptolyngbya sp. FACHB-321]MBD2038255.1 hypothetical protein [Leptolyngbya sp. FACHB-321]
MFPRYLADVAPPTGRTRAFDYCIRLDNLTAYPHYLIVAKISSRLTGQDDSSDPLVLNPGTCLSMGRVTDRPQITLFAVSKAKVSPDDLFNLELTSFSGLRIVDPEGNLVGIIDSREKSHYFDPKAQEQAQQPDPKYGFEVREGDRVLPIAYSGTVLKDAKVLAANGIPASPTIRTPSTAPFWAEGKTIEGHYTIATLTDQTFTIQESQRDTNGMGMSLLGLPLLGVILLVMVKWYHQRAQLHPSDKHSATSDKP